MSESWQPPTLKQDVWTFITSIKTHQTGPEADQLSDQIGSTEPHTSGMMSKWKLFLLVLYATVIGVFVTVSHSNGWFLPVEERKCACDKCLSEDRLFLKHVPVCPHEPFLSVNYSLSEDAFSWWKHLQNEQRSFGTFKSTVDSLLQMFPHSPDVVKVKPRPDRCRTCAVVGNSGNLRRSHYGPLIDYNDIVIRMNHGPVRGYEEDVGNRTTHRVMYPESAVDLEDTTHLVLFAFKIQDLEWLIKAFTTGFTGRSYAPVKSRIKANKDLVMVINPAFMKHVHEFWLQRAGSYPSTGFMTVILALYICDEVSVFGFGADSDGNWSHYFEKLANKNLKTGGHAGQDEYRVIQRLAEQQKIKFYRGW